MKWRREEKGEERSEKGERSSTDCRDLRRVRKDLDLDSLFERENTQSEKREEREGVREKMRKEKREERREIVEPSLGSRPRFPL